MAALVAILLGLELLGTEVKPATVVLVTRRTGVRPANATALAATCARGLEAAGVPVALEPRAALERLARRSVKDSASCRGRRACVAELGRQLEADFVVALTVSRRGAATEVGLELVRVADGAVVEKEGLLLPKKAPLEVAAFAARVKAVLLPEPAPPPPPDARPVQPASDAPTEVKLVPEEPQPQAVAAPPAASASEPRLFLLVGAGVAAAGAVVLAAGLTQRSALERGTPGPDGRVRSSLTGAQAAAVNGSSSALLGTGAGALTVGVGLGAFAVFTW